MVGMVEGGLMTVGGGRRVDGGDGGRRVDGGWWKEG